MSDTPRTDAEAGALIDAEEVVPADFARQLERDLAAAQAEVERMHEHHLRDEAMIVQRTDEVRHLTAELAALREDKARLDWLEVAPRLHTESMMNRYYEGSPTMRFAIDAAMKGNHVE